MEGGVESSAVSVRAPLRQGDVLEATGDAVSMWQRHLVVITADCDLEHGKNLGRVTCAPFLSVDEYLRAIHLARPREDLAGALIGILQEALSEIGRAGIADERLREWVLEVSPDEVVEALGVAGDEGSRIHKIAETLRRTSEDWGSLQSATQSMIAGRLVVSPERSEASVRKELVGQYKNAFRSTPGDALFISSIAPGLEDGYFAYLRHHEPVWQSDIELSSARSSAAYRRIGRLQERYAYALVQRFASVFMSVGLPSSYEGTRDLYYEILKESVT